MRVSHSSHCSVTGNWDLARTLALVLCGIFLSLLDIEIKVRESVTLSPVKPEPGVDMLESNTFQKRQKHDGKIYYNGI